MTHTCLPLAITEFALFRCRQQNRCHALCSVICSYLHQLSLKSRNQDTMRKPGSTSTRYTLQHLNIFSPSRDIVRSLQTSKTWQTVLLPTVSHLRDKGHNHTPGGLLDPGFPGLVATNNVSHYRYYYKTPPKDLLD